MQPSSFRVLVDHIAKQHRRNRDHYRAISGGAVYSKAKINTPGDQGNRSGNGRRDKNTGG